MDRITFKQVVEELVSHEVEQNRKFIEKVSMFCKFIYIMSIFKINLSLKIFNIIYNNFNNILYEIENLTPIQIDSIAGVLIE